MEELEPKAPDKGLGKKTGDPTRPDRGPRTVYFDKGTGQFSYDNSTGNVAIVCKRDDPIEHTIRIKRGEGETWKFVPYFSPELNEKAGWKPRGEAPRKISTGEDVLTGVVTDDQVVITDRVEAEGQHRYKYWFTIRFEDGYEKKADPEIQNEREPKL
jgi:hypothetical protein